MKRFSHLVIASAVAAALAAPVVAQQSSPTDPTRGTAPRDASGMPQGSPTIPKQHPRAIGDQSGATSSDQTISSGRRGASSMDRASAYGADTVRNAQQALANKGYDVGAVDGVMGPRTEAALRQFQQREGLGASGELDARTLSALNVSDASGTTRSGTTSDRGRSNRGASGMPGSDPGTTGGPAGATGAGSGTPSGAAAGGNTGSSPAIPGARTGG